MSSRNGCFATCTRTTARRGSRRSSTCHAVRVQHHAAHVAAVAGEHGLTGRVLGLALDGHGIGPNGENWGGEMLLLEGARVAPSRRPYAAAVAGRRPRRARTAPHGRRRVGRAGAGARDCRPVRRVSLRAADGGRISPDPELCPVTSSMGRLFDAASGLLGLCPVQAYEGQAAMELEALVTDPRLYAGRICSR